MPNVLIDESPDYTVTFTPVDVLSTDPDELAYQIRTAAGGAGTLLASGIATSGVEVTTSTIVDLVLVDGANTRYLRVRDGANNWSDTAFIVFGELLPLSPGEIDEGLSGPNVAIFFIFERRDVNFAYLENITVAVRNCVVECINEREVSLTATFDVDERQLPADFDPSVDFVAVNAGLRIRGQTALYTIGLFKLEVGQEEKQPRIRMWPRTEGADVTTILDNAYYPEAEFLEVFAGDNVIDACRTLCESEGLRHDFPDSDLVFPVGRAWDPLKRSKLFILNDMLDSIFWFHAFAPGVGKVTSRPLAMPVDEPVAHIYQTTVEPRLVGTPYRLRRRREGLFNRAVVLIDDPRRPPDYAFVENADPNSSISSVNIAASKPEEFDGSLMQDIAMAETRARFELAMQASRANEIELVTAFDPRRKPNETYRLTIVDDLTGETLENNSLVRVLSWRLEFREGKPGIPMTHRVIRVADPELTVIPNA